MSESLESLTQDPSNFTDPAKFSALISGASEPQADETPDEDYAGVAPEPEDIEPNEEKGESGGDDDQNEPEEEEKPLSESELQSVKFFKEQYKREQERTSKLEAQLAEVTQFLQQQYEPKDDAQAEPEYDFLDEDAVKWAKEELGKRDDQIKNLSAQQEINQFNTDLQRLESVARSRYEDFDDAFSTYQQREVKRFEAMGYPPDAAKQASAETMHKMALAAWRQGADLPDMFYKLAESVGYQGKSAAKKPQPNLDALEKNQRRSGKKQADKITPDSGSTKTLVESMKKRYNPRDPDANEQFKKLLDQAKASV